MKNKVFRLVKVSDAGKEGIKPKLKIKKVKVDPVPPSEKDEAEFKRINMKVARAKWGVDEAKLEKSADVKPKPKTKPKKKNSDLIKAHVPTNIWMPRVKACFEKGVEFIASLESVRFDAYKDEWRVVVMSEFGGEFCVTLFYDYGKGYNTKKISVEYITLENLQHAVNWVLDSREFFNDKKYEVKNES